MQYVKQEIESAIVAAIGQQFPGNRPTTRVADASLARSFERGARQNGAIRDLEVAGHQVRVNTYAPNPSIEWCLWGRSVQQMQSYEQPVEVFVETE